jgi:hypothetical protein
MRREDEYKELATPDVAKFLAVPSAQNPTLCTLSAGECAQGPPLARPAAIDTRCAVIKID